MTGQAPVAFYAPLKSPNHPVPSGDRTMARLLIRGLDRAGFSVELASEHRSLDLRGEHAVQQRLREAGLHEAEALIARYRRLPARERPRAWFTYHVYYKAPDWIGPAVADALEIPYLVAEGSRAPKRAGGPWALGHAGAEAALDRADAILVMTEADRPALERARPARQRLVRLLPFLDDAEWPEDGDERRQGEGPARLLTVAMMRPGDKLASYQILADALGRVAELPWTLDVIGDGEARAAVVDAFHALGERVRFHGAVEDRAGLAALYRVADLLVWPAINEAYGMVPLEAHALGCPVLAGDGAGIRSVVRAGETAILTLQGDAAAFAEGLRELIQRPERRAHLGAGARAFARGERGLDGAAVILRATLAPFVEERMPCAS